MATGKNNERKRIECCKGMRDDESWRDYRILFLHAREADNETFVKGFFLSPYTINVRDNEIDRSLCREFEPRMTDKWI